MRYFVTIPDVQRIDIIFDEGQDPSGGPDQFGAAILDNVDVNGVLVGRGPEPPRAQNEEQEDR